MAAKIKELKVMGNKKNIFSGNCKYVIPLYQRPFAWEEEHITQLIEDILDADEGMNYYIGSLIVSKEKSNEECYEVIDGQQRLTTLFLLLNCLDIDTDLMLTFACRDKSNFTLKNIKKIMVKDTDGIDSDMFESSLVEGIGIINQKLHEEDSLRNRLLKKLKRVVVYRIEVPENTDLNRYFEIMNTRGEQLEQHDILKAKLMNSLSSKDQNVFATIWEACSDMTGYIQMHFKSKNNEVRNNIFGYYWNSLRVKEWKELSKIIVVEKTEEEGKNISQIIKTPINKTEFDGYDEGVRVRFDSIIEFPYFLIHTLKVFVEIKGIIGENNEPIMPELLDDKKLVNIFSNVLTNGRIKGKRIDEKEFSRDFIMCLLKTRYLFDKYIIKREYKNDSLDGEWSLKRLEVSGQGSNKKPYYKNTRLGIKGAWDNTLKENNKSNLMIQSALRVSYVSPKVMHWITKLLLWLSIELNDNNTFEFESVTEEIAKEAVRENFLDNGDFEMGVNTPRIVFNYLDYLIWKANKRKYDNFIFEFRNSVEHWYPQHPSQGQEWDKKDVFGNLCIVQRNINSKFSNMPPTAKKSFTDSISNGSLKLRIMSELTSDDSKWIREDCEKHQEEMIKLLKKSCYADEE